MSKPLLPYLLPQSISAPIDALMKKAFSSSSFNSNTFLTRLLIHMGLLKVRLPSLWVTEVGDRAHR